MDRFAVFVDAGYVYGAGGSLLYGTSDRGRLYLDVAKFNKLLVDSCGKEADGLRYLRTYWYDGAKDASPTPTHLAIAAVKPIKLRLGRLTLQGQKGVDSRIVRDLITLFPRTGCVYHFLGQWRRRPQGRGIGGTRCWRVSGPGRYRSFRRTTKSVFFPYPRS